jgi:hypothetical protein
MAGKNTAAFGIYRDRVSVENAVDALRAADFRNTDISVLFPENEGTKDFAVEKQTKAPEGTTTGATSGAVIGGGLGWLAGIGALAIPGLGPLVRSWPLWRALVQAAWWEASQEPSWAWAFRNSKPSATKAASRKVAFYFRSIATTPNGRREPSKSLRKPVPKMSRPPAKLARIFRKQISQCNAQAEASVARTKTLVEPGSFFYTSAEADD